jgi:hypothetical protein
MLRCESNAAITTRTPRESLTAMTRSSRDKTIPSKPGQTTRFRGLFSATIQFARALAFRRLMSRAGLTRNDLAIPRNDSPLACRFSTSAMSTCAGRLPSRVPALRVLANPALVRSEIVIRSCSASVAIIEGTTSLNSPHESKYGSWKLRHATPQLSSCWR